MITAATATLTADEELHWLALRLTPGLGPKTAIQLLDRFHTPQAIFRASSSELEAAGASASVARNLASGCAFEEAVTQQQRARAIGAHLIPYPSPQYPSLLRQIYDPPPLLFVRGRLELLQTPSIAMVGTRHPSAYGTAVSTRLATDLANAGLTITSGMARGVDTAAHKAALEVGGATIAVFGCGVDELYPAENKKLADQLAESGLIVSDFPFGMPPYPQNFPIRNRIVSGLSLGVLIVEGGQYSGSAITARLASEQGREVFAVPGNITSKMSYGPNLLIKQGAKLVQDWNDVVTELKPEDRRWLAAKLRKQLTFEGLNQCGENASESDSRSSASVEPESVENRGSGESVLDFGPMTGLAKALLRRLTPDAPAPLDDLVACFEPNTASEIIATLFELELAGLVRQLPGKTYLKVWN